MVVCCNSIISVVAAMPRQLSHQYHCGALYMTFSICLCVFVVVYLYLCGSCQLPRRLINIIAVLVWWIYVHHHLTQILFELLPKSSLYHLSSLYFLDLNTLYLFLIVLCPNNLSNIKGAVILNLRRSFNFDIPNIFYMQTITTTFTKKYFSII